MVLDEAVKSQRLINCHKVANKTSSRYLCLKVPGCTRHNPKRLQRATPQATSIIYETEIDGTTFTAPALQQPRGIIHFLGGAFAGAAPQLAYQFLIRWLADAGYTVVATPYKVTFRHLDCAVQVHEAFLSSVSAIQRTDKAWMVSRGLPIHGVGHSNGALLHLLIGSRQRSESASNVLISYNNRQVKEAVPVPLDGLQSLVKGVRSTALPATLPTTEVLLERAVALSAATRGVLDRRTAAALQPALDQIGSILDEVEVGYFDFIPSPPESRSIISSNYSVPNTLLLKFATDSIDETPLIVSALQRPTSASTGAVMKTLPGTHLTPCGADISWQVGRVFTPLDAAALATKVLLQADVRRTARTVVQWLNAHS